MLGGGVKKLGGGVKKVKNTLTCSVLRTWCSSATSSG